MLYAMCCVCLCVMFNAAVCLVCDVLCDVVWCACLCVIVVCVLLFMCLCVVCELLHDHV